jgi:flavin reductase (DIM6/NTAB) family NADH-FMN oxidoreductase RutF
LLHQLYAALKSSIVGPEGFHHACNLGLSEPQREVTARLHGLGRPLDITSRNVIAGLSPLVIGIGLKEDLPLALPRRSDLSMKFYEAAGENKLLAEISLRRLGVVRLGTDQLGLFRVQNCRNYCLPALKVLSSWVSCAWQRSGSLKDAKAPNPKPTALESQCLFAFYICPRPVLLVSVVDGEFGNIFPMDLIGPIGHQSFSLALHSTSTGIPFIKHSGRVALSSVPIEQAAVAYALGKNHKIQRADWQRLPFATIKSAAFGLPVPQFSPRVREMQVAQVQTMGTHTLFICDVIEDRRYANGSQLFIVHGFYQSWRKKQQSRPDARLPRAHEPVNASGE